MSVLNVESGWGLILASAETSDAMGSKGVRLHRVFPIVIFLSFMLHLAFVCEGSSPSISPAPTPAHGDVPDPVPISTTAMTWVVRSILSVFGVAGFGMAVVGYRF